MMGRIPGAALAFGLALALSLGLWAPGPLRAGAGPELAAQPATLSAQDALVQGNVEMARLLALAALETRPEDADALAVLAAVGLSQHQTKAAGRVGLMSWKAAQNDRQRFAAARLVARAAYEVEAHTYAKLWLRRAVEYAPDEASRTATIRDFQTVRDASPLTLDLGLSLSPSDNVNQGVNDPMLVIDGRPTYFIFDDSTMALSGIEARVSLGARYRLAADPDGRTDAILRLRHRAVALSDAARRMAPDVHNADLAIWEIEAGLQRSMALSQKAVLRGGLSFGQNWLGGQPYARTTRAQVDLTRTLSARSRLRLGLGLENQNRLDGLRDATALTLDGGFERVLASGDRMAVRLELGETLSNDANQENTLISGELRYLKTEPVAGAQLSASLGLGYRDYPVFFNGIFGDGGRQETALSASIDLALPAFGAFGFEPVVSVKGSRTLSNVSRYDTRTLGIGLTIRSSF